MGMTLTLGVGCPGINQCGTLRFYKQTLYGSFTHSPSGCHPLGQSSLVPVNGALQLANTLFTRLTAVAIQKLSLTAKEKNDESSVSIYWTEAMTTY